TIAGRSSITAASAPAASAASPTTRNPSDSSIVRANDRNDGWSSTISTVGCIESKSPTERARPPQCCHQCRTAEEWCARRCGARLAGARMAASSTNGDEGGTDERQLESRLDEGERHEE